MNQRSEHKWTLHVHCNVLKYMYIHYSTCQQATVHLYMYIRTCISSQGCDLNLRNNVQRTALHVSAMESHCRVMEHLVGYGADMNAQDKDGNTALHITLINKKNSTSISHDTPQMKQACPCVPYIHYRTIYMYMYMYVHVRV